MIEINVFALGVIIGFVITFAIYLIRIQHETIEFHELLKEKYADLNTERERFAAFIESFYTSGSEKRKNEDILEDETIPIMPSQTFHAKARIRNVNYGKIYYPLLDQYESDEQFVKRVSREWWMSDEITNHDSE